MIGGPPGAARGASGDERLWRLLAGAVRVALVLVGLGPVWVPLAADLPGLSVVAHLLDGWYEFQCHRDPGRTIQLGALDLAVCTRCAGIYFGLGLGALALQPRLGAWPLRAWVAGAALLMVLDVATESVGLRPAWAPLRLATGLLLAYPVGVAVVLAARGADSG
ncbi:MAG: DUF2085 domain-containing protein [Polyangiaceae bacterium]|nr:DUF2085 domain-containing protein [Polyangiaceae bacterium]